MEMNPFFNTSTLVKTIKFFLYDEAHAVIFNRENIGNASLKEK